MAEADREIRFYFDLSCPYAYLGSLQLDAIEARTARRVALRPFLLGGVFAALGQAQNMSTTLSPPKQRHNRADLLRQAAWLGAPLRSPLRHPNRTVEALRALLCAPADARRDVMHSFFAAYWRDAEDIADPAVLGRRLDGLGLDANAILDAARGDAARAALRAATDDALAVGVFGAPAFVVDDELFWGADRVEMVIHAARDGWSGAPATSTFTFNQATNEPIGGPASP